MAEVVDTFSFNLPKVADTEVFLVRLPDGRVVARTKEELEAMPEVQRPGEASSPDDRKEEPKP